MPILCIVAAQRSGTTALQSALGSSGTFENLREIFQTGGEGQPGRYLDYVRARGIGIADLADEDGTRAQIDAYIDHLLTLGGAKVPVIDVKFNSWLVMQPFWAYPHQEPLFMRQLKSRGAAFLLIRRRNLADQVLSEMIARQSGIWHDMTEDQARIHFAADLDAVREQARLILQAENFFGGLLASYSNARSIIYEDLYHGTAVNPEVADFCFRATGKTQLYPLMTPIQKNAGKKSAQVSNYDAAVAVVDEVIARFGRHVG